MKLISFSLQGFIKRHKILCKSREFINSLPLSESIPNTLKGNDFITLSIPFTTQTLALFFKIKVSFQPVLTSVRFKL